MLKTFMIMAYLMNMPMGHPNHMGVHFNLSSPAFTNAEIIPVIYTCHGKNISVPLHWSGAPPGTRSLALIMIDRDVPRSAWYHWSVYNIPPTQHELQANISLQSPIMVAANSWGYRKYQSPCPPQGEHHYIFHLYALDTPLPFSASTSTIKLRRAMQQHIIAETTLMGIVKVQKDL